MPYIKLVVLLMLVISINACANSMDAEVTAKAAQMVTDASQAVQATTIDEVVNMDVNIPLKYVLIYGLAWWCVRTPWGLVSDFLKIRRSG